MTTIDLSAGELQRRFQVYSDQVITTPLVLQIVSPITLLNNQAESIWPLRICMVSDGKSITWAKIALLEDETIAQFNIIKINQGVTRKKASARDVPLLTIIVLDLEILGTWYERIGKTVIVTNQDDSVPVLPLSSDNKIDHVLKAFSAMSAESTEDAESDTSVESDASIESDVEDAKAENAVSAENAADAENIEKAELQFKTVAQISNKLMGALYNRECFLLKCTVVGICADKVAYALCPNDYRHCIVTKDDTTVMWHCKGCKGMWSNPLYIYQFNIDVSDDTGHIQLHCLNNAGKLLLGATAVELFKLQRDDKDAFAWKLSAPKGKKYVFKCMVKPVYLDKGAPETISVINGTLVSE
ncbi:Replication factor A protein 1 [Coemansia sp. RSA 2337]|nr:Replication factor A protein 1 [Coemansia sp. RSA 2337]